MKKKAITGAVIISLLSANLLAGCAGRTPNPVQVYQPDDQYMNCSEISYAISQNQQKVYRLYPKTQKTGKNVALGITGAFFIVPLFFMDFSDAEKVEIEAFQRRDDHLHFLAEHKGCYHVPKRLRIMVTEKKKAASSPSHKKS